MTETFRHYYAMLTRDPRLAFYVRSCGYFHLTPPDREQYRHKVDFGEIFWCIRGSAIFRADSRETVLTPDHAWYYPPGADHDYLPRGGGFEYRWLTVAGEGAAYLFAGLEIRPGASYAGPCPQHLFSLVELNLKNALRVSRMQALAAAFQILTMLSPGQRVENVHRSMAGHAKSLIDSGFSDREFNVDKVASLLGVHRGSLSQAFTKSYGVTVSRYITGCRIRRAADLLTASSLSIREIAAECGFNSHEYFSRVFQSHTGDTPSAFRRREMKNGAPREE